MRDDEKMFKLGLFMFIFVVSLVVFLQVGYRVQNDNLEHVNNALDDTRYEFAKEETKFVHLSSGDSLRGFVVNIHPSATTVSYSKTIHINDIPMRQE